MTLERSLPHGHVAAVLGMARQYGIEKLLALDEIYTSQPHPDKLVQSTAMATVEPPAGRMPSSLFFRTQVNLAPNGKDVHITFRRDQFDRTLERIPTASTSTGFG